MTPISIPEGLAGTEQWQDPYVHLYYSSKEISRNNRISVHGHLFSFVLEGAKEVHFQEETVKVQSGQALLIGSGHCLMTDRASAQMHYRTMLLFFTDSRLKGIIAKYKNLFGQPGGAGTAPNAESAPTEAAAPNVESAPRIGAAAAAAPAPAPAPRKSCFLLDQDNYVQHIMSGLMQAHKAEQEVQANLLPLLLEELIVYLAHQHPPSFAAFVCGLQGRALDNPLTMVVENNMFNNLSLEELAFLCHMSLSTFKRKFELAYGMSPIRWFHERRMERAALLLRQQQRTATEIHEELGYENLSSFIQAFKKEYGMTPKTYQGQV
jgi:AraC-like DNA-binding protein